MSTRSRFVRSFAALGTAVVTAAATLTLGAGTATAQEQIATSWRIDGAPSPLGPDSLTLVRADDSEEILDATGDITESFSGPAGIMRRYALLYDYFNPSQGLAIATATSGGVTTITATHSYPEPSQLEALAAQQHVRNNAMMFGEIGSYTGTATYSGDARYRETTYAYDARLDRLEDVRTRQPTTLTIDASAREDGVMPFTVTSSRDLYDEMMYQCAEFDDPQAYWNPEAATTSGLRDFSGSCALDDGYSGAVVIFVLSMDGPGEIIVVDPTTGGTNASVNPANSLGPGQQITISGEGLEPTREYTVWVESTPREIGTVSTDAQGAFSGPIILPNDLGDGRHDLFLRDGITDAEIPGTRTPFTFSQRADPTLVVPIEVAGGTDPVDPAPAPGSSLIGSLGSS